MSNNESWYSRGPTDAKKMRDRIGTMYKPTLWVKDGESVELTFLDMEAFNVWQHEIWVGDKKKTHTCRGKGCPLCVVKEPRFCSVYRVLDPRVWKDKQGKTHKNEERYYEVGSRLAPTIEKLLSKGFNVIEVSRKGAMTDTVYSAVPGGEKLKNTPEPTLNFKKDYMPKSIEELEVIASLNGGVKKEREPEEKEERKIRSYLKNDDDDDDEKGAEEEDFEETDETEEPSVPF